MSEKIVIREFYKYLLNKLNNFEHHAILLEGLGTFYVKSEYLKNNLKDEKHKNILAVIEKAKQAKKDNIQSKGYIIKQDPENGRG